MQNEENQNYAYQEDTLEDIQPFEEEAQMDDLFSPSHTGGKRPYPVWRLFLLQSAICALIMAALGGMKLFSPTSFEAVKEGYQSIAMTGEDFRSGFTHMLDSVRNTVNQLTPLQSDSHSSTSSEGESSQQPEASSPNEAQQPNEQPEQTSQGAGGEPNLTISGSVPANCTLNAIEYPFDKTLPLSGKITSRFGDREYPLNGQPDFHTGIDIAANEGTPIVAMSDGIVEKANPYTGYGNHVTIRHKGGFKSLYAHCSRLVVTEGQKVKKGQVIAYVGSTGASTGNHLHFGIQKDGVWCNPAYTFPEYR